MELEAQFQLVELYRHHAAPIEELWLRYIVVGGMAAPQQLEAVVNRQT
jgi:hypothetical protein